MESLFKRSSLGEGKQFRLHNGEDFGFLAQMGKVGREPVAKVDGCAGEATAAQRQSLLNAGLGIQVGRQFNRSACRIGPEAIW